MKCALINDNFFSNNRLEYFQTIYIQKQHTAETEKQIFITEYHKVDKHRLFS
jgi:hypothetical protein